VHGSSLLTSPLLCRMPCPCLAHRWGQPEGYTNNAKQMTLTTPGSFDLAKFTFEPHYTTPGINLRAATAGWEWGSDSAADCLTTQDCGNTGKVRTPPHQQASRTSKPHTCALISTAATAATALSPGNAPTQQRRLAFASCSPYACCTAVLQRTRPRACYRRMHRLHSAAQGAGEHPGGASQCRQDQPGCQWHRMHQRGLHLYLVPG
jgi:hypothetical protein